MKLTSTGTPHYLPEPGQKTVLRLGIQPLAPAQWLQPEADLELFYRHKTALYQTRLKDVCQSLPSSNPAQAELRDLMLEHLITDHSHIYSRNKDRLVWQQFGADAAHADLQQCALWVAEDLCLLEQRADRFILTAGSVCSASHWKLSDKIGLELGAVHAPVPDYQTTLNERVNRLLKKLQPGKPLLRYNWSLQPDNELFWEAGDYSSLDAKFWRVERQTLRKLPRTGAVVFGIRIFLYPLDTLLRDPAIAHNLQQVLANLPAQEKSYKNLPQ